MNQVEGSSEEREIFTEVWRTLSLEDRLTREATHEPGESAFEIAEEAMGALPELRLAPDPAPELELREIIGEGGMGQVFLARQLALLRDVAVKLVRPDRIGKRGVWQILHEACVVGSLEHPNIVPVHELGRTGDGRPVLVMKRIEGTSWARLLQEDRKNDPEFRRGRMFLRHLEILRQVCRAVAFAHSRRIVHRDLKPSNVMIGKFGEVYLVDWGTSVCLDPSAPPILRSRLQGIVGTLAYIAPEMVEDPDSIDEQTDVYLLGATLHELLTGESRHLGSGRFERAMAAYWSRPILYGEDVPRELAALANRATFRDRGDRMKSAEAFLASLETYLDHRSSTMVSAEASGRLENLREHLRTFEGRREGLDALFTECRFAFRLALRSWPQNTEAERGLQECLELMIDDELGRGAASTAELLLHELPRPNPGLEQRIQLAERHEREDRVRLGELEREEDLEQGSGARRWAIVGAGLVGAISAALRAGGLLPINEQSYVAAAAGVAVIALGILIAARRTLLSNRANRRVAAGTALAYAFVVVFRLSVVKLGLAIEKAVPLEIGIYFLAASLLAATVERRVLPAAIAFGLSGILAVLHPESAWTFLSLALALGFTSTAIFWDRLGGRAHAPETTSAVPR